MENEPISLRTYELIAEQYAARVDTKPHNAYYDRPAMLSLLPPVRGLRALDAGCGPGVYTELLIERGATEVIAIDVSPKMVKLATERLNGKARVIHADFEEPLDFLEDKSCDLVLCALAMDYVRDWSGVLREFHRILRPNGNLLISVQHPAPLFFQSHPDGNYFDIERVSYVWTGFGTVVSMPYYRRSLSEMINPLIDAGFILEHVLEPRPVDAFKERDPKNYDTLMRQPCFICFRARRI